MRTFFETVEPIIAQHSSHELQHVIDLLGAEAKDDLSHLDARRRAALVDRLIRNLRGMSVTHGPRLERDLLKATSAEPSGLYRWELSTAAAIVELRSNLRYLGAWLGFDWSDISRLQAAVCGLVRWIQATGSGVLQADVDAHRVHFRLRAKIAGFDLKTVDASPFVEAVRAVTQAFLSSREGDEVVLDFYLYER